jgi:hypothetical protein
VLVGAGWRPKRRAYNLQSLPWETLWGFLFSRKTQSPVRADRSTFLDPSGRSTYEWRRNQYHLQVQDTENTSCTCKFLQVVVGVITKHPPTFRSVKWRMSAKLPPHAPKGERSQDRHLT